MKRGCRKVFRQPLFSYKALYRDFLIASNSSQISLEGGAVNREKTTMQMQERMKSGKKFVDGENAAHRFQYEFPYENHAAAGEHAG
jgi:hypothetical protein